MQWIQFDENDRRTPAPNFCLKSLQGKQVCLRDYREDCNLVLFIPQRSECPDCPELLQSFAVQIDDYRSQDAKILAVLPEPIDVLSQQREIVKLPYTVLSDPALSVYRLYAGLMVESLVGLRDSMIFILDRYNAPYAAVIGKNLGIAQNNHQSDENIHEAILKWLQYISIQCPE